MNQCIQKVIIIKVPASDRCRKMVFRSWPGLKDQDWIFELLRQQTPREWQEIRSGNMKTSDYFKQSLSSIEIYHNELHDWRLVTFTRFNWTDDYRSSYKTFYRHHFDFSFKMLHSIFWITECPMVWHSDFSNLKLV